MTVNRFRNIVLAIGSALLFYYAAATSDLVQDIILPQPAYSSVDFGIFPDLDRYSIGECLDQVEALENELGLEFSKVSVFGSMFWWGTDNDYYVLEQIHASGRIPEISLGLREKDNLDFTYGVVDGVFDENYFREQYGDYFKKIAGDLALLEYDVILRLGYEFNSIGMGYGPGHVFEAKDHAVFFSEAWSVIVDIFRENDADNVLFFYCPSWNGYFDENSYPGDEYVDIVGVDGYDLYMGDGHPDDFFSWLFTPETVFHKWLDFFETLDKPIAIGEIGSGRLNPEHSARWLLQAITLAVEHGAYEVSFFNYDKEYMLEADNIFDMIVYSLHGKQPNTWERDWRLERDPKIIEMLGEYLS